MSRRKLSNPIMTGADHAVEPSPIVDIVEETPTGEAVGDSVVRARAALAERNAEAQAPAGDGQRKPKAPRNVSYLLSATNRYTGSREQLCCMPTKGQLLRWMDAAEAVVRGNYDQVSILRVKDVTAEVLRGL